MRAAAWAVLLKPRLGKSREITRFSFNKIFRKSSRLL